MNIFIIWLAITFFQSFRTRVLSSGRQGNDSNRPKNLREGSDNDGEWYLILAVRPHNWPGARRRKRNETKCTARGWCVVKPQFSLYKIVTKITWFFEIICQNVRKNCVYKNCDKSCQDELKLFRFPILDTNGTNAWINYSGKYSYYFNSTILYLL